MRSILHPELRTLAPAHLPNRRKGRYLGDDQCLPLGAFDPGDQRRLQDLYGFLSGLFAELKDTDSQTPDRVAQTGAFVARQAASTILGEVREFGLASVAANPGELMAKTTHDLRGGALSALLGWLQLGQVRAPDRHGLRRLFFLTRDHLKIMRNALVGLDDEQRRADLTPQFHGTDLIVEKWRHGLLAADAPGQVRLRIESGYDGHIAECCVEFGALDRVLYNLVNNASRHIVGDEIGLFILPTPEVGEVANLRFVVTNRIGEADQQKLAGRDLRTLFEPGVSSTGSGFGMTVVADFVSNAFGISREQALEGGYLGAKVWEGRFLAWFHWPIAEDV